MSETSLTERSDRVLRRGMLPPPCARGAALAGRWEETGEATERATEGEL
jgi:hypothetical protein